MSNQHTQQSLVIVVCVSQSTELFISLCRAAAMQCRVRYCTICQCTSHNDTVTVLRVPEISLSAEILKLVYRSNKSVLSPYSLSYIELLCTHISKSSQPKASLMRFSFSQKCVIFAVDILMLTFRLVSLV